LITKIVICGGGDLAHNQNVESAFYDAYPEYDGTITHLQNSVISGIITEDYDMFIQSTTGMTSYISTAADNYPSKIVVMPAGSNSFTRIYNSMNSLPCIIVTGAGDIANETGYDIEFFSPDTITIEPDLSSYSNAFIAGQLAKVINTLDCGFWEARYRLRMTASVNGVWHSTNGYGLPDTAAAIAYSGEIITDPYLPVIVPDPLPLDTSLGQTWNMAVTKNVNTILTWPAVANATNYKVYKSIDNGVTYTKIYEGALLTYSDTLAFCDYPIKYKYIANNETEVTEYSSIAEIKHNGKSFIDLNR